MSKIRHTLVGICIASASLSLMAQTADEHKAHHPAGSTLPASTQMKAAAKPTGAGQMAGMAKMDEHMKAMQAMHEKMMAAKTLEERQALMDEHMKLMQDGMGMMHHMGHRSQYQFRPGFVHHLYKTRFLPFYKMPVSSSLRS